MPLVALLASASTLAATVYKWTDEQGVVHYSDQPHPQAKEVDVKPAPTISSVPPSSAPRPTNGGDQAANSGPAYQFCEIYRPEKDEVFLNTDTMTAKVRLQPNLKPGHQIALAIDGQRQKNLPTTGTEFVISNLTRGSHSLLMVVEDGNAEPLCTSQTVTFHVRQPSVQAPVRTTRPKF